MVHLPNELTATKEMVSIFQALTFGIFFLKNTFYSIFCELLIYNGLNEIDEFYSIDFETDINNSLADAICKGYLIVI